MIDLRYYFVFCRHPRPHPGPARLSLNVKFLKQVAGQETLSGQSGDVTSLMKTLPPTSVVLLTLLSLGYGQDLYRRSECSHDSQVNLSALLYRLDCFCV